MNPFKALSNWLHGLFLRHRFWAWRTAIYSTSPLFAIFPLGTLGALWIFAFIPTTYLAFAFAKILHWETNLYLVMNAAFMFHIAFLWRIYSKLFIDLFVDYSAHVARIFGNPDPAHARLKTVETDLENWQTTS